MANIKSSLAILDEVNGAFAEVNEVKPKSKAKKPKAKLEKPIVTQGVKVAFKPDANASSTDFSLEDALKTVKDRWKAIKSQDGKQMQRRIDLGEILVKAEAEGLKRGGEAFKDISKQDKSDLRFAYNNKARIQEFISDKSQQSYSLNYLRRKIQEADKQATEGSTPIEGTPKAESQSDDAPTIDVVQPESPTATVSIQEIEDFVNDILTVCEVKNFKVDDVVLLIKSKYCQK